MSREEWRNKIAQSIADAINAEPCPKAFGAMKATDAVLALLEEQGRVLWWCPDNQITWPDAGGLPGSPGHSPHRRGVFIELEQEA